MPEASACAPPLALSRAFGSAGHRRTMGDIREACAGRGDGTDCPHGEIFEPGENGPRCEECRHYWELDETEPGRRGAGDDGLTRPSGDPGEAGPGVAA